MVLRLSKKICLLGDFAVGKTSLVRRFVYDRFDDKYISTIGVKVSRKTVVVSQGDDVVELTLMLWDLAGSEEFSRMRASYLRGSAGAALVCDLTRLETLGTLRTYAADLRTVSPDACLILAANKHDLTDQQQISVDQIEAVAAELNAPFYLTSAKTGEEVETLFRHLGQLLVA
ncbi:MAG: GTP-binding protein [Caldilineae bacterium]|nr:MAG: GTP-binding protein [Caldilineae bacterium]